MWDSYLRETFTIRQFWLIIAGLLSGSGENVRRRWKQVAQTAATTATPSIESLPAADSLCSWCRYSEDHHPSTSAVKRSRGFNKDFRRLKKGAAESCWLCQALLSATQLWRDFDVTIFDRMIQFDAHYNFERFTISGQACFPGVQIYCPEGKPQALRLITDREIPTTALYQSSYNFVSRNLRQCIETHTACHQSQLGLRDALGGEWPKRMLRIDKQRSQVKLVPFELSMASKYMALSYCWGCQKGHLRATSETLPQLCKGVSINSLPRTLEDAVQVAISLGSELIWIDSVCIIQDDPQDLNEEAGKMSSVYAQALLTIIANSSSSCNEGFLSKRRQESIHLTNVRVSDQATEVRARVVHDWGHHRGGSHAHESHYSKWVDPVDKRAWTLQERLLSTRYVTYTSGEIQWGCQTLRDCECGQPLYGKSDEQLEPDDQWFAVLEEYSNRRLSVHTDKLTALAGIARKMSIDLTWQHYAAGIWIDQQANALWARGLLWRSYPVYRKDEDFPSLPTTYTAPTYSWASIIGKVIHYPIDSDKDYKYPTKVLDVAINHASPDGFGGVSGGHIRLVGPLLQAKIRWNKTDSYPDLKPKFHVEGFHKGFSMGGQLDVALEKITLKDGSTSVRRRKTQPSTETESTTEAECEEAVVFVLPIRVHPYPKI
ncbi:HET-domain-containing protein, partial [Apiospora rasikravindrae]